LEAFPEIQNNARARSGNYPKRVEVSQPSQLAAHSAALHLAMKGPTMTASEVLKLWRDTPAAADWGPGSRVKFCLDRRGLYSIHDEIEILGLVDIAGSSPKVIELFDEGAQDLLLAGMWRDLR
jgi:hypothetical protein